MTGLMATLWAAVLAQSASPEVPLPPFPRTDGRPLEVKVGIEILDFARITSRDESYEATFYLELGWMDPQNAGPPPTGAPAGVLRRLDPKRVWAPRYFFENAIDQPKTHHDPVLECDEKGETWLWVIVSGRFSAVSDLRRFPFDRQRLPVRLAAFDDVSLVRFVVNPELVTVEEDAFATDWEIGRASARTEAHQYIPGHPHYSRLIHSVEVTRRSTFYIWRVLLPLTLLALVSFAAFWFEPLNLQPQISTCMAALIALVAFNFAIDFSLPKVAYLTLLDKYGLVGFTFVALAVAGVTIVHRLVQQGRVDAAHRVQWAARFLFPLGYALAIFLVFTVQ